jgi:two-component system, NtrC family, sensor kinase
MLVKRLGLQGKIVAIIAITVFLVVGISTYIAMWLTRLPVEEDIYRKALAQARFTAHELINRGALQNSQGLLKALGQMQHDVPGVKQSDVYLHFPEHRLVVTTNPDGEHLELDHIPDVERYNEFEHPDEDQIAIETPAGDYWIISTAIRDQSQAVGCLNLKISKSRLNAITWDLVLRNLLLMMGSLAVVMLVIHIFFLRSVRSPVREMIRVMEAAEGGQLDLRAGASSGDEIGELAEHLNRMLARIENFKTDLARKVEEATVELALRNEELKNINEELFETQKSLARSERLAVAGQLAASLAHEIGTPLNSISGHVQLLARRKSLDEVSQRRLQIIENQIDHIVRTVKQLLSWTRKFDLRIEPIDLRRVLKDSVLLSSPTLQQRKIKVQIDLPRDCPAIYGDAGYLQQVFLNLINNSMDAMPEGGELKVRLRYPNQERTNGGHLAASNGCGPNGANSKDGALPNGEASVTVEVADTGHGINPETRSRIFEPMFTTKRMGTGAGLGLAICDQIVRQHGGRIQVQSELSHGTVFAITLPVDCRPKVEAMAGAGAAAVGGGSV